MFHAAKLSSVVLMNAYAFLFSLNLALVVMADCRIIINFVLI